jgi:hypothetical protein
MYNHNLHPQCMSLTLQGMCVLWLVLEVCSCRQGPCVR